MQGQGRNRRERSPPKRVKGCGTNMASLLLTRGNFEFLDLRNRVKKSKPYQSKTSFVVFKVTVKA
jgi:hypothetical protein